MCRQVVYVEMAVQVVTGGGVGQGDPIAAIQLDSSAQLRSVDLAVIDRDVQALIIDLEILTGLVEVNNYVIISTLMKMIR